MDTHGAQSEDGASTGGAALDPSHRSAHTTPCFKRTRDWKRSGAYVLSSGSRLPLIGEDAPAFEAETTQGRIKFPSDFQGQMGDFRHPADFTPVCTTEFMTFASMQEDSGA